MPMNPADAPTMTDQSLPKRESYTRERNKVFAVICGFVTVIVFTLAIFVSVILTVIRLDQLEAEVQTLKFSVKQLSSLKNSVSAGAETTPLLTNGTASQYAEVEIIPDSDYIDSEIVDSEKALEYDDYYYNDPNNTYANKSKAPIVSTENPTVEDKLKSVHFGKGTEPIPYIRKEETPPTVAGSLQMDDKYFKHTKSDNHVIKKRNVIASTHDGVPINSEPYSQREHKMRTGGLDKFFGKGYTVTSAPARPSAFGSPWTSQPEPNFGFSRNTYPFTTPGPNYRHISTITDHRRIGKNLKSADLEVDPEGNSDPNVDFTVVRKPSHEQRDSNVEFLDGNRFHFRKIKPLPATQYNGDTSKYVLGQHTNFNGNGHLRHPQRTFVDWAASSWVQSAGMDEYFSMDNGIVSIKENGLYFIYAQIYYLDEHDMVGYRVYKNGDIVLQCTITYHSSARKLKGNTCFTAGVEYLSEGDAISLADITEGKYSLFEPGKSFFGMIRIGDIKVK